MLQENGSVQKNKLDITFQDIKRICYQQSINQLKSSQQIQINIFPAKSL
jgi:hypothetical protein